MDRIPRKVATIRRQRGMRPLNAFCPEGGSTETKRGLWACKKGALKGRLSDPVASSRNSARTQSVNRYAQPELIDEEGTARHADGKTVVERRQAYVASNSNIPAQTEQNTGTDLPLREKSIRYRNCSESSTTGQEKARRGGWIESDASVKRSAVDGDS